MYLIGAEKPNLQYLGLGWGFFVIFLLFLKKALELQVCKI